MSFLLPAFWSAMALAVGIVVLYLIREKPRRRKLSSLLFWDQLHPKIHETPLWRRLRRWISLLLQILFLALLVFALARPVAEWELTGARSRVFVLDPSASMSASDEYPTRFERAKADLRERFQRMRFFDEAALVVASDPPEVASGWTRSRRRLLEALDRIEPLGVDSDARPAVEMARNLLVNRENAEVVFLSDGVERKSPDAELAKAIHEKRYGEPDPENVGISMFAARRSLVAPGEFTLMARMTASGNETAEIEILRDGNLIDAQSIDEADNWRKTWNLRSDEGGTYTARIRPSGRDVLELDNEASLTLSPLSAIDVVLVSPLDAFLEAVFKAMPGVNVKRVWPVEAAGNGDAGKLWIFNQAVPPAEFSARGLVLIAPSEGGFWGEKRGALKDPVISEVEENAPLVQFTSLEKVRLGAAGEYSVPPEATTFASSFGSPVIFGRWGRGHHWLVLAFDLERSDLVLRTAFPVLMENVVHSLRSDDDAGMQARVPGEVESRLAAAPAPDSETAEKDEWIAPWTVRPLWWWAVLIGAFWLLAEWWTYHRRITE